jgi:type III secretion system FlhB-like substrate exporter
VARLLPRRGQGHAARQGHLRTAILAAQGAGALSNVELGDEIPAELYKAVAEVLIFVLRLSGRIR